MPNLTDAEQREFLTRIENVIANHSSAVRTVFDEGPFKMLLDPVRDVIYVNYAVPVRPLRSPREQVGQLISAFRANQRTPKLEFAKELWPDLEEPLILAGFRIMQSLPMLACSRTTFKPRVSSSVQVRQLGEDDDVRIYYETANEAFEMQWPVSETPVRKASADQTTGPLNIALGYIDGKCAGCACLSEIWELSGIGTLPKFRRRGVASTICTHLLTEHFKTQDLAWLAADDEAAEAVYEGLGFTHVGTHVSWILGEENSR